MEKKSTADNSKNSHILAIAQLAILIIMISLAYSMHIWPPFWMQAIQIVVTTAIAYINFKVVADNGDSWKAWAGMLNIFASIVVYCIPISSHSV